jgi:hypothetical protein
MNDMIRVTPDASLDEVVEVPERAGAVMMDSRGTFLFVTAEGVVVR